MKKVEYPNRGHLIPDYFIDGISRVYEHEENLIIILETPTGLETPNAILKNECARLIIPKNQFDKFYKSIVKIQENFEFKEVVEEEPIQTITKDKSFLGSAFNVSD